MKNNNIINNTNIQFVKLLDDIKENSVENVLLSNFDNFKICLCKKEIENYIYNNPHIINVKNNAVTVNVENAKLDNDIFTNLTADFFNISEMKTFSEINIPQNLSSNFSTFANISIEYVSNCDLYKDVINLKKSLYYMLKTVPDNIKNNRFIFPISKNNGANIQQEQPNFNLICEFSEPTYLNLFSIGMNLTRLESSIVSNILADPIDMKLYCKYSSINTQPRVQQPYLKISIFGQSDILNDQEFIDNIQKITSNSSNPLYSTNSYLQNMWDELIINNEPFLNNKKYSKYKFSVSAQNLNTLIYQNFGYDKSLCEITPSLNNFKKNSITRTSFVRNVKNSAYFYNLKNNSTINGDILIKNLKIYDNGNITQYQFLLNPLYKQSFKYGNLINGINVSIVTYDENNYNNINDSTILETVHIDITNIDDFINFNFLNHQIADLINIPLYNIEIEILYDVEKYKQLFKVGEIEAIEAGEYFNNYDYNLKFPNISSMLNKQPKPITLFHPITNAGFIVKKISKKCINAINIPTTVKNINISMTNDIYGKYIPYDGHLAPADIYQNDPSQSDQYKNSYMRNDRVIIPFIKQVGLLEIAQCDGTAIIKRDFTDGNSVLTLKTVDLTKALYNQYYEELLNWENAFNLTWDRLNNNNQKFESIVTINFDFINILENAKYLIIKLLLKPDTANKSKFAQDTPINSIYKTIEMSYTVYLNSTKTIVNNVSQLKNIINDKNVAYYFFNRGVTL